MSRCVIALGSNLGDRLGNLQAALAALLERSVVIERRSSVWESDPLPAEQPRFLNAAAVLETTFTPRKLLTVLKDVERALGRRPAERWGPRPIDLDILYYGDEQVETVDLTIPHPRTLERPFVLAPLVEVLDRHSERHSEALTRLRLLGSSGLRRTPLAL